MEVMRYNNSQSSRNYHHTLIFRLVKDNNSSGTNEIWNQFFFCFVVALCLFVCNVSKWTVFDCVERKKKSNESAAKTSRHRSTQPMAEPNETNIDNLHFNTRACSYATRLYTRKHDRKNCDALIIVYLLFCCFYRLWWCAYTRSMCVCMVYFNLAINKQEGSTSLDPYTLSQSLPLLHSWSLSLYWIVVCSRLLFHLFISLYDFFYATPSVFFSYTLHFMVGLTKCGDRVRQRERERTVDAIHCRCCLRAKWLVSISTNTYFLSRLLSLQPFPTASTVKRRNNSVHKGTVEETSALWRELKSIINFPFFLAKMWSKWPLFKWTLCRISFFLSLACTHSRWNGLSSLQRYLLLFTLNRWPEFALSSKFN